ncbi:MAG TPA: DUF167 domain-containing protein [Opitutaceae bacterium]|nr:DUF167 domain-containing protein [Opitutaceae bacterium]
MTPWLEPGAGGVRLAVVVTPRASRTELAGVAGGRLRVRVAAPPVDGAANEELVRFLARHLGLARSAVALAAGAAGRRKTVLVTGMTPDEVARRLSA